jgi:hypothetical protein
MNFLTEALMKISDQLNSIRDAIKPWAQQNQGKVEIARSLVHLYGLLSTSPGGFRAAIQVKGEDKRGEHEEASMVDREFWVAFSFGQSMQLNKGEALVEGQAGGRPLADLAEELRDQIRACQMDGTTEVYLDYKGCHELTDIADGFNVDGFYLRFTIGTLLPPPGTTAQTA